MTRCAACGQVVALVDRHDFGGTNIYHPACCPQCRPSSTDITQVPAAVEVERVERAKRGCRRGTPRAWALRGAGG